MTPESLCNNNKGKTNLVTLSSNAQNVFLFCKKKEKKRKQTAYWWTQPLDGKWNWVLCLPAKKKERKKEKRTSFSLFFYFLCSFVLVNCNHKWSQMQAQFAIAFIAIVTCRGATQVLCLGQFCSWDLEQILSQACSSSNCHFIAHGSNQF